MRAPSSFHSTDASPTSASAVPTSGAPAASIGRTPRPTSSPTPRSPAAPSVSATTAVRPRSPDNIAARRTSAAGTDAARATASRHQAGQRALAQLADEQAPHEIGFRRRRPTEQRRAGSSSRPAADPLPVVTRIWSRARSTSAIASVGTAAGVTSSRNTVAQPTPTRPWRGLAGEEPHRRLDLVGCEPAEQVRERGDLGRARPRRGNGVRSRDEIRHQHGDSVPEGPPVITVASCSRRRGRDRRRDSLSRAYRSGEHLGQ